MQLVDFGKLEMSSLKKYQRYFKIETPKPNPNKDELIRSITKHFVSEPKLRESQVISQFLFALRQGAAKQSAKSFSMVPPSILLVPCFMFYLDTRLLRPARRSSCAIRRRIEFVILNLMAPPCVRRNMFFCCGSNRIFSVLFSQQPDFE